jgi:hypothetical protein
MTVRPPHLLHHPPRLPLLGSAAALCRRFGAVDRRAFGPPTRLLLRSAAPSCLPAPERRRLPARRVPIPAPRRRTLRRVNGRPRAARRRSHVPRSRLASPSRKPLSSRRILSRRNQSPRGPGS